MVDLKYGINMDDDENDFFKMPRLQKCLKWLQGGNIFAGLLIGTQIYFLLFLIVFSCQQGADPFYFSKGERYEFVQQMRKNLVKHDTVHINFDRYEEKYLAPAGYILERKKMFNIRKSPVEVTYENGDVKDCGLFDSKIHKLGFMIMCDQEIVHLNDWGEYNMVFEDEEKCFQATLYTDQNEKITLKSNRQCSNIFQIFERHTSTAHVTIDIETLTKQDYVLESDAGLATSIVLNYHNDNPARWTLQERHKNKPDKNGKITTESLLYETSVLDLKINNDSLKDPDSCLGIEFRTTKDNTEKRYYIEITEQCDVIARLYKQTTKDISRTYSFHELIVVENSPTNNRFMPNIPSQFRIATFIFNFDEPNGTPSIYRSQDNDLLVKTKLDNFTFEDMRTNKFENKYCYKMVIETKGFGFATLYLETFCEQLFVDTTYFRKLQGHNAPSKPGPKNLGTLEVPLEENDTVAGEKKITADMN